MPLTLEIVTQEKRVYRGTADAVVLPTAEGEIDILPGHLPIITMVQPGEVTLDNPGPNEELSETDPDAGKPGPVHLAVDKGFVRVLADTVSILTEGAIRVEDIDLEKIEEAEQRAKEALERAKQQDGIDEAELEALEARARFAVAQNLVRRKRL